MLNWKLIFLLSLFGLAMAFATVFFIPQNIEPAFWLVIFAICAYLIVKNTEGKYFLHGFLVSMVNSVWLTAAHVVFFDAYMASHPDMAKMSVDMPMANLRVAMVIMGPVFGAIFGIVLGLFSFIAGKIIKK